MLLGRRSLLFLPPVIAGIWTALGFYMLNRQIHRFDRKVQQTFNFVHLQKHLPSCIIIGAKKGGTRALLDFINIHPDVKATHQEVDFFNSKMLHQKGLEWYRSLMPTTEPGEVTIEKSANYFSSKATPKNMFKMHRKVKLILAIRDPVERAISDFVQSYPSSNVTFEELAFVDEKFTTVNKHWLPIRISTYEDHIVEWLRFFPLTQILVVDCAELTNDPAAQIQRVEKFLGLQPRISKDNFYYDKKKGFLCWRHNGVDKGHCLGKSKGVEHPQIHLEAMAALRRHFATSNKKFAELVGRNFSWTSIEDEDVFYLF